ncbi:MAG: helix-turn-helix transcriptional regulator [Pseudomonadota bacterium]
MVETAFAELLFGNLGMGEGTMVSRNFRLTEREILIIKLIAAGNSAKEVAGQLDIAPRTVQKHLDNSRLKLDAKNTTHLVALCIAHGVFKASAGCAA